MATKPTVFLDCPGSSQISSAIYKNKSLTIVFRTGSIYTYDKVPEKVWIAMQTAKSVGTFLNTEVKGKYEFKQIL